MPNSIYSLGKIVILAMTLSSAVYASPLMAQPRADTTVNPAAVTGTTCTDPTTTLVSHDINVAVLGICGGIAGTIEQCAGNPTTTTGESGTAKFTLNAATAGDTIIITKGRWEGCVRAAQAVCGNKTPERAASNFERGYFRNQYMETRMVRKRDDEDDAPV